MIRSILAALIVAFSFVVWPSGTVLGHEPLSIREAAELLSSSVVEMTIGGNKTCSASKIGPKTFLTAAHCVRSLWGNYRLEHGFSYQFVKSILITVSKKDDRSRHEDWAILNTTYENDELTALELGCAEDIYLGMPVAYAGYPGPVDFAFGAGYVTSLKKLRKRNQNADFVIDVAAAPGASGSPIISLDTGHIVGILIEGVSEARRGDFMAGIESIRSLGACQDNVVVTTKPVEPTPF